MPPKVEYQLAEIGYAVEPILKQLEKWGECYIDKIDIENINSCD